MKKHFLSVLAFFAFFFSANAQTNYDFFAVSSSGDTLYYYLNNGTAAVTCNRCLQHLQPDYLHLRRCLLQLCQPHPGDSPQLGH